MKAIAKKPEDRYPKVTDFTHAVRETVEGVAGEKPHGKPFKAAKPEPRPAQAVPSHELPTEKAARPLLGLDLPPTQPFSDHLPTERSTSFELRLRVGELVKYASNLFDQEKYVEVLQVSERIIALDPNSPDGWFYKGVGLCRFGKWEETLEPYARVLQLDPQHVVAMGNMADSLLQLGRHEEALKLFNKTIRLDPSYTFAHFDKGLVLEKLNRPEEAIAAYDQALSLDPKDAMAFNNKGIALNELGRPEEAEEAFQRAKELEQK